MRSWELIQHYPLGGTPHSSSQWHNPKPKYSIIETFHYHSKPRLLLVITYWKWISTDAKKRGSRPSGTKITQIFQAYDYAATYLTWKITTQRSSAHLQDSVSKWPFFISIRLNAVVQWGKSWWRRTMAWKCWSSIPGSSWLERLQRSLLLFESHYA